MPGGASQGQQCKRLTGQAKERCWYRGPALCGSMARDTRSCAHFDVFWVAALGAAAWLLLGGGTSMAAATASSRVVCMTALGMDGVALATAAPLAVEVRLSLRFRREETPPSGLTLLPSSIDLALPAPH